MNMSEHTSGNGDPAAKLANKSRAALRQLIRRMHVGHDGDGPGLPLQHKPLLRGVSLQPGIGVAGLASNGAMTAPTMGGDVRIAETACLALRMVADPKDGRGSALVLLAKDAELINDSRRRRGDWLASKLNQLPADRAGKLGQAVRYLDEIGK